MKIYNFIAILVSLIFIGCSSTWNLQMKEINGERSGFYNVNVKEGSGIHFFDTSERDFRHLQTNFFTSEKYGLLLVSRTPIIFLNDIKFKVKNKILIIKKEEILGEAHIDSYGYIRYFILYPPSGNVLEKFNIEFGNIEVNNKKYFIPEMKCEWKRTGFDY